MNTERARRLRRLSSRAEKRMWKWLRDRRFHGWKFRRQHPLGPYYLDFYCVEARLTIELDGFQHYAPEACVRDQARDAFLRARGIETLRYSTAKLWRESEIIKSAIYRALQQRAPRPPTPCIYGVPGKIQRD